MEKNFTVKEFVDKYNSMATDNLKEKFVKENLKSETYIPYLRKITLAEMAIDLSSTDKETGFIHIISSKRTVAHLMLMINEYTNLEIKFETLYEDYDLLNRYNIVNYIFGIDDAKFEIIPRKEVSECNTLLSMSVDDFMTNKYEAHNFIYELTAFIATILSKDLNKLEPLVREIISKYGDITDEEKGNIHQNVTSFVNKIMKK